MRASPLRRLLPPCLKEGECVRLLQSALVALALAAYRAVFAVRSGSWWLFTLALYAQLLGLLWIVLLFGELRVRSAPLPSEQPEALERRVVRRTARLLVLLWLALCGMIVLAVECSASFSYPGHMIYASALYAFYAVISSAAALLRRQKDRRPIASAARTLRLVRALTSLFGLQTALLSRFSQGSAVPSRLWNALTGGVAAAAVLAAALRMRFSSHRRSPKNQTVHFFQKAGDVFESLAK